MISQTPPARLRMKTVGDRVRLTGDRQPVTYTIKAIQEDGFYSLWYGDSEAILASPCHLIEELK